VRFFYHKQSGYFILGIGQEFKVFSAHDFIGLKAKAALKWELSQHIRLVGKYKMLACAIGVFRLWYIAGIKLPRFVDKWKYRKL
jgi:hypothetical protein